MVLQETEAVVQTALSDTILATCRKTLPYHDEFSIEGMLHIVLDKKEVVLVNIKETVFKQETRENAEAANSEEVLGESSPSRPVTRRGRKPKKRQIESDNEVESKESSRLMSPVRKSPRTPRPKPSVQYVDSDDNVEVTSDSVEESDEELKPEKDRTITDEPLMQSQTAECETALVKLEKCQSGSSESAAVVGPSGNQDTNNPQDEAVLSATDSKTETDDQYEPASSDPEIGKKLHAPSPMQTRSKQTTKLANKKYGKSLNTSSMMVKGKGQKEERDLNNESCTPERKTRSSSKNSGTLQSVESSSKSSGTLQSVESSNRKGGTLHSVGSSSKSSGTLHSVESSNKGIRTLHSVESSKRRVGTLHSVRSSNRNSGTLHSVAHKCPLCKKICKSYRYLKVHVAAYHSGGRRISCKTCHKVFQSQEELSGHQHPKKEYMCDMCGATLATKHILKMHQFIHTDQRPYTCRFCPQAFRGRSRLKEHERIHTGEKPYKCEEPGCEAAFINAVQLRNHLVKAHDGVKPFSCTVCNRGFLAKEACLIHQRTHTGEKPYQCPECSAKFADQRNLKSHRMIHTGEKPFQCEVCGDKFTRGYNLKKHFKYIHGDNIERPYECSYCKVVFKFKGQKLKHEIEMHTGGKYKCSFCDLKFIKLKDKKAHEGSHSESARPHKCQQCGKAFKMKKHLLMHMTIHTGEKRFQCEICQEKFRTKSNFVVHTRTHTGEKPFMCDMCGRRFSQAVNLRKHKCKQQPENSSEKSNSFEGSLLSVVNEKGKKCSMCKVCEKVFNRPNKAIKHIISKHGDRCASGGDGQVQQDAGISIEQMVTEGHDDIQTVEEVIENQETSYIHVMEMPSIGEPVSHQEASASKEEIIHIIWK